MIAVPTGTDSLSADRLSVPKGYELNMCAKSTHPFHQKKRTEPLSWTKASLWPGVKNIPSPLFGIFFVVSGFRFFLPMFYLLKI